MRPEARLACWSERVGGLLEFLIPPDRQLPLPLSVAASSSRADLVADASNAEALAWLESQSPGLGDLPVEDWQVKREEGWIGSILGDMGSSGGILGEISGLGGLRLYSLGR